MVDIEQAQLVNELPVPPETAIGLPAQDTSLLVREMRLGVNEAD